MYSILASLCFIYKRYLFFLFRRYTVGGAACLLRGHHGDKFFIVDLAVAVNVGLADHFVHLLIGQLLAQVGHYVAQLGRRNVAIAILVKYTE